MTQKAILVLAKLNNRKDRNRLMREINHVDQDQESRVGGDQEIKALKEMIELEDEHQGYTQGMIDERLRSE